MPKVVTETPARVDRKYAWDEWTDGELREFVKGEDFECSTRSFSNAARKAAFFRQATIEDVEINMRGNSVFIRFIRRTSPLSEIR
jgi:hypothetical protein